jgi:error-prone DNA polymerase
MPYAELHSLSNFTFLRGASQPVELVTQAEKLGYKAIAITDECSLAGIVKAHVAAKQCRLKLLVGTEITLENGIKMVLLASNRDAYGEISHLITRARRRMEKGRYRVKPRDIERGLKQALAILLPSDNSEQSLQHGLWLQACFKDRLWIGLQRSLRAGEENYCQQLYHLAQAMGAPIVACGNVHMHIAQRKPLQDTLSAIRHNCAINELGARLQGNAECYLRPLKNLSDIYPATALAESCRIAARCNFSLDELRYDYPRELVPAGLSAAGWLQQLAQDGASKRWPRGIAPATQEQIDKELGLISEMQYEYFFLTVFDIVHFARSQGILCQGRGSAANSVVCYCLFITEVSPDQTQLLFERFISRERNEPPDIDVDFEHERREEVIQYIYRKYTREHAALAATVITYRPRSAIRDVGKALGLSPLFVDQLARSLAWWDRLGDLEQRFAEARMDNSVTAELFMRLVQEILGFPRHLSQHVGGFVITRSPISTLVPVENAAMADRTVIQWDKEDIEALGLLKVDVLALGMLSAIRKSFALIEQYHDTPINMASIPQEDPKTYNMLCQADSIGVFQVESRAQMAMLPRLKPRTFYDLVIEVAIVRPGPIQGDMVHPYLKRRQGIEPVSYPNDVIQSVLERTLGVPIFQEQVIKLAMVAAGFSGGEADQLRRSMASWGHNGNLMSFRDKLINGMRERGHSSEFAERLFRQMQGFGEYGFPESHAASFALLAYVSAWLKCHYPAAFYCGLLNSQPMGFYSPSQLVQDARRHHIEVRAIDIDASCWNHSLELVAKPDTLGESQPALRLGLRLAKNLSREGAERLVEARQQQAFSNMQDLVRRAQLSRRDMESLVSANALPRLSPHRHQSHWQYQGMQEHRPLLSPEESQSKIALDDDIILAPPSDISDMLADYDSTGLSLKLHPLALLRRQKPFSQCKSAQDLSSLNHRRFVRVAGLVTGRQRPGSAAGVVFLTLEDETGNMNIVVWKDVQQRFRQALLAAKLLLIKGVLECKDGVIHIIAGELLDYTHVLKDLKQQSRDFH